MGDRQPSHLFQVDMGDNLFQSNFALRFQEIKIPSLLRFSVGNKVGLRVDTEWGERATQRGTIIVAQNRVPTYSEEFGDGDTCIREVEKHSCVSGRPLPFAKSLNHMRGGA